MISLAGPIKSDVSEHIWSWVSNLEKGKMLMQGGNGGLFQGIPNKYDWDSLENLENRDLEPMQASWLEDGCGLCTLMAHFIIFQALNPMQTC